jgi:hypothetical protein
LLNALRSGMCHASIQRLQVGMNVGEQCNFHNVIFQ